MPLIQFNQGQLTSGNDAKSCGAASILVTLNELGKMNQVTKVLAMAIYTEIRKACLDESPIGNVTTHLIKKGVKAKVIENTTVTGAILASTPAMQAPYDEYVADLKKNKVVKTPVTAFKKADFDGDARVMLVCIIKGSVLTHYVLARRDGQTYSVMNPDGGVETVTAEAKLLEFMNTPGKEAKFGAVTYIFTGICVQSKL